MNYERLYEFRFRDVNPEARQRVWNVIAGDVHRRMRYPHIVLDAAGGSGEFINAIPAIERWMVDRVSYRMIDPEVKVLLGDILEVDLPTEYFDGVFVSNVLEHLPTQETVAKLLERLREFLRPSGVIAIMGPNFRYCAKDYFDCADHTLALTDVSVEEHLYAAGFNIIEARKRYLPYSFRGCLPADARLTAAYLRLTPLQSILGKQFLVVADKS
jgi:SAM-dependent methyltransferase